jgi:hypothetical protein
MASLQEALHQLVDKECYGWVVEGMSSAPCYKQQAPTDVVTDAFVNVVFRQCLGSIMQTTRTWA